jgi:hypothetical protein
MYINIASCLITQQFETLKQLYREEEVWVARVLNRDFLTYRASHACLWPAPFFCFWHGRRVVHDSMRKDHATHMQRCTSMQPIWPGDHFFFCMCFDGASAAHEGRGQGAEMNLSTYVAHTLLTCDPDSLAGLESGLEQLMASAQRPSQE